MLTSFGSRLAPAPAHAVNLSLSLEGLENVIPPSSPLSLAGRPYYLRLDKPLPEKPLPATPLSMGYSTVWSQDSSSYGNSTRCSSRDSSRYSKETCPNLVSSASDDELEEILHQHEPIQVEPVSADVGKNRVVAAPSASPDPLEAFLADDGNDNDNNDDDHCEDEPEMSSSTSSTNDGSYEDEVDIQSLRVRHTIIDWAHHQHGPNHYFREKKLDFFPELAPPGALSSPGTWPHGPGRPVSALQARPPKKRNLSAFDFGRLNLTRGNMGTTLRRSLTDRSSSGMALASNVRSSIRSAVQRTLSKHSSLEREKEKRRRQPRPSTAQRSARSATPATPVTPATPATPATTATTATSSGRRSGSSKRSSSRPLQNYEDVMSASLQLRSLSVSPRSSTMDPLPVRRPRPLAVPPSPYQKYGAAIWEKPAPLRPNRHRRVSSHGPHVRFPRYYQNHRRWSSSFVSGSASSTSSLTSRSDQLTQTQSNPVLPVSVSPPLRSLSLSLLQRNTRGYIKALQTSTSHMLGALDGAKQRVVAARIDRRRAQLKAQIRLVGPVDPSRAHEGIHPWV